MPTYGYECTVCKEKFEVSQRITEAALTIHEGCGGELRRLLYPVGIVFKGSGFYVNDYAKKSEASVGASEGASEGTSETKTEAKSEPKTETKTETDSKTAASAVAKSDTPSVSTSE